MSLDGLCIHNGEPWCSLSSAWDTQQGWVLILLALFILIVLIVAMNVLHGIRSFIKSRKGDL